MRLVSRFWQTLLASWLNLKLLSSLGQFLVWFGWQTYTKSSVLLISFIWLAIAVLLATQQYLYWNQSIQAAPLPTHLTRLTNLEKTNLKLWNLPNLLAKCELMSAQARKFPTHRDLAINASLCNTALGNSALASEFWNQAKDIDPNSNFFAPSSLKISTDN